MTMTTKEVMEKVAEWDGLSTTDGYEVTELDSNDEVTLYEVRFNGNEEASFMNEFKLIIDKVYDADLGGHLMFIQIDNGEDVQDMKTIAKANWMCVQYQKMADMADGMPVLVWQI